MRGLRHIMGIPPTFIDRSNTDADVIRQAEFEISKNNTGPYKRIKRWTDIIKARKCTLVGHVIRAEDTDPMKIITKSNRHFYESKRLNLSSRKANSDIKWKTILSQQNVIKFIINWYKAYNNKENMKNYSKNQILEFYKISKMKKL